MARVVTGKTRGQPVLILKEGATQTRGREAQRMNITVAKMISEAVRTSLGPKGMDKMLVSGSGEITVTNDGATILKQMDVQHPMAKILVEVAKTTDQEVGDGTTSAVVLAGGLLSKAEEMLRKNMHPSVIVDGFKKAAKKSLRLYRVNSIQVEPTDREMLKKIASTAIATKAMSEHRDLIAEIGVGAVLGVADKRSGKHRIDIDDIKIDKAPGDSLAETNLVKGIIVREEVAHRNMPKIVQEAKIALLELDLEVKKTQYDAKLNITSPEKMKQFMDAETNILRQKFQRIVNSEANVVINNKGIDDVVLQWFAKEGILAVKRTNHLDMIKLSKATGGTIITSLDDFTPADLGRAKHVEEKKIGDKKWLFVEGCKNPRSISVLIRGGTKNVVEEAERAMRDVFCVVRDVVLSSKVVVGGGAAEAQVASELRQWAERFPRKEQLAIRSYSEALELIPSTLAENAGLNPVDAILELRSRHGKGERWSGVNAYEHRVDDMSNSNVFEPLAVKEQIVKSASEAVSMILRIDDVIAAPRKESKPTRRYPEGVPPLERESRKPPYM